MQAKTCIKFNKIDYLKLIFFSVYVDNEDYRRSYYQLISLSKLQKYNRNSTVKF